MQSTAGKLSVTYLWEVRSSKVLMLAISRQGEWEEGRGSFMVSGTE